MKKTNFIYIILIGIIVIPIFNGCKKGDQDPFLSLRSRDGRLINEWKLTKIQGSIIQAHILPSPDVTTTINYSYDGAKYSEITAVDTTSETVKVEYTGTYSMNIKEDGTVTINEVTTSLTNSPVTKTLSSNGTWVWAAGNKKKDHLLLSFESTNFNFKMFNGGLVYINRLSSKELVLKINTSDSYATGSAEYRNSSEFTYTFEKK